MAQSAFPIGAFPGTGVGGVVDKYCTSADVYRKAGIDSSVVSVDSVNAEIVWSDAQIDKMFQKSFFSSQSVTEWHDVDDLDEDEVIDDIFLDKRPVQSITSLESYDKTSTLVETWTASDYWLDEDIGRIRLRTAEFAHQKMRVKCVYTYGYSSVPIEIQELSAVITAMKLLIIQIGGTYDDVTSYSLPSGVSISVGEPYMNMTRSIEKLDKERKELIKSIGQLRTTLVVV